MVTVEVYWQSDGSPANRARVEVWGTTVFGSCGNADDYTDSSGKVHLDIKPGNGKIRVNGQICYEGEIQGRVPVYI